MVIFEVFLQWFCCSIGNGQMFIECISNVMLIFGSGAYGDDRSQVIAHRSKIIVYRSQIKQNSHKSLHWSRSYCIGHGS